ncbi:MAG TPA: AmmeMemoRadiSam system protein A [Usitatibacter sp.]
MTEAPERGTVLLAIAREAIADPVEPRGEFTRGHDWLRAPAATFVTLLAEGELRGCIGSIDARRALGEDVARNAHAAAYRDPRFPPLESHEHASIAVEVSVLTPRVAIIAATEDEALASLRPGADGIFLQYRAMSATFLPQVWESLPDPVDFLAQLRRKAGLPAHFWHADFKLSRYSVEKFQ